MKKLSLTKAFSLCIVLLCMWLASCQKVVHISLAGSAPTLVVDGAVESGVPPYVVLTTTLSYFSNIDLSTLENTFVHGAKVTVSDGTSTITLKEYAIDTGNNTKFYIYSIDSSNIMFGQVGKFYTLSITYNGQTYTSTTKIPAPKGVDSMWFTTPTFTDSKTPDSAKQMFIDYTDPDTAGNYVRYYTQRNSQPFYPSGIFSDETVNGKRVDDVGLYAGYLSSDNSGNKDSLRYFFPGDVVTLKWCEIDKGVYTFWNTLQFASNAVGNPFSTPINPTGNISNGALGVWAGYGSLQYTQTVP
jgi:hypothetical protein